MFRVAIRSFVAPCTTCQSALLRNFPVSSRTSLFASFKQSNALLPPTTTPQNTSNIRRHSSGMSGRGAYYKAKYGGGGGAGNRGSGEFASSGHGKSGRNTHQVPGGFDGKLPDISRARMLMPLDKLRQLLHSIDGKQYGAYKDLYDKRFIADKPLFELYALSIQGDSFAPPSTFCVEVPLDEHVTKLPKDVYKTPHREIILADYLSRRFQNCVIESHKPLPTANGGHSGFNTPKLGSIKIHPCGEAVLPRTSCSVIAKDMKIKFRFFVSLPARGRNILGDRAAFMLCDQVTDIIQTIFKGLDLRDLNEFIRTVETQEYLRNSLDKNGLVAFIANGSILPRGSGVTDKPLANAQAVPFKSPPEYEVAISTPYSGAITGMGIPYGVTVITGGGFHGKSTLLEALQNGIYNYIPGDGRELVVTNNTAVKVRSEDGRAVTNVDITPFITKLPSHGPIKMTPETFTTKDASGSTSLSAAIQESLEVGSKLLLLDEDSCATNLLIRDERMARLNPHDPIIPFVSKVRALYDERKVSTIIVIGGCGAYLSVANRVIGMMNYSALDLTAKAREIVQDIPGDLEILPHFGPVQNRKFAGIPHDPHASGRKKVPMVKNRETIVIPNAGGLIGHAQGKPMPGIDANENDVVLDVSGIEQLIDVGQTRLLAHVLAWAAAKMKDGKEPVGLRQIVEYLEARFKSNYGLEEIGSNCVDLVYLRGIDVGSCLSRLRGVNVVREEKEASEESLAQM